MRFAFMEKHLDAFPVSIMAEVLAVSESGFYAWRTRPQSDRSLRDQQLLPTVRSIHAEYDATCGSRRLVDELTAFGAPCGRHRARRLMRLAEVMVETKKKFRVTTDSKHALPVAENVLNREFSTTAPNQRWAADITYLWTSEGWLYLAVVLDLYSRMIVGWSLKERMTRDLVDDALTMALWRRKPKPGLLHHSDRGSQYCALDHQRLMRQHGITVSMSRKGNCWDNACVESFFHTLKVERVYRRRYATRDQARLDVLSYLAFYNGRRRHSTLGNRCPIEFEAMRKSA